MIMSILLASCFVNKTSGATFKILEMYRPSLYKVLLLKPVEAAGVIMDVQIYDYDLKHEFKQVDCESL